MILEKDDYLKAISDVIGSRTDDESISFMENMTDTYNALEEKANNNGVDVEALLKAKDDAWRERYTKRFFSAKGGNSPEFAFDNTPEPEKDRSEISINELFG